VLIFVSNVYNGLYIARVFEMKDYPAPNTGCILVVHNALAIRML